MFAIVCLILGFAMVDCSPMSPSVIRNISCTNASRSLPNICVGVTNNIASFGTGN